MMESTLTLFVTKFWSPCNSRLGSSKGRLDHSILRPVRRSHEVSKSKYFNKDLEAKTARGGRNSAACLPNY